MSDCNISTAGTALNTGARSGCVSDIGHFDMVGNVWEWVADWGDFAPGCTTWSATYGTDILCVGGDGSTNFPGALIRGASFIEGPLAGVFAAINRDPSTAAASVGFRCAREL
jgi:formylglycine-generating enzyme required for sulfatase activity